MVTVAAGVWERWRELEELAEPAIVLLFTSNLPNQDALVALRKAAAGAIRSLEQEATPGPDGEDPRTGHWEAASVPEGIALRIDEEPDDFERLVEYIVRGLEAQGIDGRFALYEPAEAVELPERIDLLEARLRVNGARHHIRSTNYEWRPDWSTLLDTVDAGLDWCVANAAHLPLSLRVGLISPAILKPQDDVTSYVREGLEQTRELGVVHLTSGSPDRFRTVAVSASHGRVTFIGGGDIESGWRASAQGLLDLMVTASERLVYGFIKRGEGRSFAELGTSLIQDWPRIPHFNAWNINAEAFEDEFVPDAFGTQLLGPGYVGRVPTGPNWKLSPVGRDRVVVEHVDPAAWFEALLPSGAKYGYPAPETAPIPAVLLDARRDFAQILFRDDTPVNG